MLAKAAGLRTRRLRPAALTCDFRSARSRAEVHRAFGRIAALRQGAAAGCRAIAQLIGAQLAKDAREPYARGGPSRGEAAARRAVARIVSRVEACGGAHSTDAGLRCGRLRPADPCGIEQPDKQQKKRSTRKKVDRLCLRAFYRDPHQRKSIPTRISPRSSALARRLRSRKSRAPQRNETTTEPRRIIETTEIIASASLKA